MTKLAWSFLHRPFWADTSSFTPCKIIDTDLVPIKSDSPIKFLLFLLSEQYVLTNDLKNLTKGYKIDK